MPAHSVTLRQVATRASSTSTTASKGCTDPGKLNMTNAARGGLLPDSSNLSNEAFAGSCTVPCQTRVEPLETAVCTSQSSHLEGDRVEEGLPKTFSLSVLGAGFRSCLDLKSAQRIQGMRRCLHLEISRKDCLY